MGGHLYYTKGSDTLPSPIRLETHLYILKNALLL